MELADLAQQPMKLSLSPMSFPNKIIKLFNHFFGRWCGSMRSVLQSAS